MYRKAPIRRMANYLRTGTGGDAQTILAHALDLENSEFRLEQLDKYKEMRAEHSGELKDRAAATLTAPPSLPAPKGVSPAGKDKKALLEFVTDMRSSTESSLADAEFIQQVIFDHFGKQTIDTLEEFAAVWDDIVNEKQRDLATGQRIPDDI